MIHQVIDSTSICFSCIRILVDAVCILSENAGVRVKEVDRFFHTVGTENARTGKASLEIAIHRAISLGSGKIPIIVDQEPLVTCPVVDPSVAVALRIGLMNEIAAHEDMIFKREVVAAYLLLAINSGAGFCIKVIVVDLAVISRDTAPACLANAVYGVVQLVAHFKEACDLAVADTGIIKAIPALYGLILVFRNILYTGYRLVVHEIIELRVAFLACGAPPANSGLVVKVEGIFKVSIS